MNGFQNKKRQDLHKPIPSCMGRMISIFDMSVGVPRTKLLTEKPHQDELTTIHKNQPDVVTKKAADHFGAQKEAKMITSHMLKNSSKTSGGIPMKMLIAQEMLREPQSIQKPSNVVAKLMGLETLPLQQSIQSAKLSSQDGYSHNSLSRECQGYNTLQEYKDVHEVRQQPSRNTRFKDKPLQNKVHDENSIEKRMELVHQKFTEAKRLAANEKLLQSKEFQEAIEVLSSNRDLFLKFFEEPNSLISKHAPKLQTIPSASQTRRITVLKPSKMMEPKGIDHELGTNRRSSIISNSAHHKTESISQPTRIVVLKPSLGMPPELKARLASPSTSSRLLEGGDGCLGPDDVLESREIAREITRKMQEYVSNSQQDEMLLSSLALSNGRKVQEYASDSQKDEMLLSSSALSNGYVGDESSFNRSENGYIEEECGYTSDLESPTPTSQHSCDYSFRLSPCSISSFSQVSHSSEPSVVKEAKKRLSERLALMTSNGINQEQSQMHRSSSTLGEMLAIHEVKKEEASDNLAVSSRNFTRSKSVPISSSVYENFGLTDEPTMSKSDVPKAVVAKPKSGMSSFKGKVSSLFLSRIKKAGREKPLSFHCLGSDRSEASHNPLSESFHHGHSEESILVSSLEKDGKFSSSTSSNAPKKHSSISKASISFGNQDHPSPNSVLESPFEEDPRNSVSRASTAISSHPQALSRSPPIGSISRTLAPENPPEIPLSRVLSKECEEQDRSLRVHKLLSRADLAGDVESNSILARWHSLDSPLDPALLDEFLDRKEEEAKCRERRSNQRLLFDCVNEAILSIGHATLEANYPWAAPREYRGTCRATLTEEVSGLVKKWFSCESENRNLTTDKLVKKEMGGNGWVGSMCLEVDDFSREVGEKILEELVEEALADLTDGCL